MGVGGRWAYVSTRPVVEDGLSFAVHPLAARGGGSGSLAWSRDGERFASIGFTVERYGTHGTLTLRFKADGEDTTQRIALESSACRFGGWRWYARCPRIGRRVSKLHTCGGRYFLSRQAYGAAHASQNECPIDRAIRGRNRVLRKLRADDPDYQPKPKWMRWPTYDRLQERLADYHSAWDAGILAWIGRLA